MKGITAMTKMRINSGMSYGDLEFAKKYIKDWLKTLDPKKAAKIEKSVKTIDVTGPKRTPYADGEYKMKAADVEAYAWECSCNVEGTTYRIYYENAKEYSPIIWEDGEIKNKAELTNVNACKREAPVVSRKTFRMNCATGTFDEKAFDKYLNDLVDNAMEYIMEQGYDAQTMEQEFPGYDAEWCPAEYSIPMHRMANKIRSSLLDFYKEVYLGNK